MRRLVTLLLALVVLSLTAGPVAAGGNDRSATLTGAAERPGPGDPDGTGTAQIRLNVGHRRICYTLTVRNITLPAAAAHIHVGGPDVAGPIVVGLTAPDAAGNASGCVTVSKSLIKALKKNPRAYYVNVHTSDYPAGAVRGQLHK